MNSVSSLHRLGRDVIGDVINSSMSLVNRPHLWVCEPQDIGAGAYGYRQHFNCDGEY